MNMSISTGGCNRRSFSLSGRSAALGFITTVYSGVFRYGTRRHFDYPAYSVTGNDIHHITVDTCRAYDNSPPDLSIRYDDGGNHDNLFVDCVAHDNRNSAYADHGFYVKYGVTS